MYVDGSQEYFMNQKTSWKSKKAQNFHCKIDTNLAPNLELELQCPVPKYFASATDDARFAPWLYQGLNIMRLDLKRIVEWLGLEGTLKTI
ncbi:hypothetical protein HGM15179_008641 [Zosterops borbonicus]|uniref:Uncharacterized protein n=1 Tax=Zosterops borbonicus TaxID=364589 RepID=A0A8K1GIG7_9PASS|nr:hypothetical protein HGM15179_008641 [Zosterops borbonicus]